MNLHKAGRLKAERQEFKVGGRNVGRSFRTSGLLPSIPAVLPSAFLLCLVFDSV
jgi:hypothetical protein